MTKFSTARLSHVAALVAGAAALGLATPAIADEVSTQTQAQTQATSQQEQAQRTRSNDRRICVRSEISGSRMARRICRTAAEWDALNGVGSSN